VNLLQISDAETTGNKEHSSVYVLGNKSNGVGFYRWTDNRLGSGRVYLTHNTETSPAHEGFICFDDEEATTSIKTMDNEKLTIDNNVQMYNLNGQHVSKNYKGVVIQNGKKINVK